MYRIDSGSKGCSETGTARAPSAVEAEIGYDPEKIQHLDEGIAESLP